MMHPELMHIVISSHHEYLRSLAKNESILDELQHATRSLRNARGRGIVRTGRWLEGHSPSGVGRNPAASFQEP